MTPWTVAHQAPLSMEFSKQEYWSGLPFPPPGNLPDPQIKSLTPVSLELAGGFFTTEPHGKPHVDPYPHHIKFKWVIELNGNPKVLETFMLLEENIRENLCDLG